MATHLLCVFYFATWIGKEFLKHYLGNINCTAKFNEFDYIKFTIFVVMLQEAQITYMGKLRVDALIAQPSWVTSQESAPAVSCPLP